MSVETHRSGASKPFTSQIIGRGLYAADTLTGAYQLTNKSAQLLRLDPGGASRNVTLPAVADGLWFEIVNTADAAGELLVIKNPADTTLVTLHPGAGAVLICGASWSAFKTHASPVEDALLSARGTIAFASVRTLNATPVTMIPAPGAGLFVDVVDCHWFLDFGTQAYDGAAAGETLGAKYTNGAGAQTLDTVAGNAIGSAAADYHALVRATPEVIPVANAAIVAHIDAGEWYAAAGNSPLKWEMHYRIRTLDFV